MDDRLAIPPGILRAVERSVETAVSKKLDGLNLVDLKECQEALKATRVALLDMQQNFLVWQKLAEMRSDENERLRGQVAGMNDRMVGLRTEIALLRSTLENRGDV